MKMLRKKDTRIPRRPLLWLAAALLFTLPPMFGTLPSWVPLLFLIALAAKFWMEPKAYRLRFTARRAYPVSSRLIIRLLATDSQRCQTSRPGRASYYLAVPLFSAHQYRTPISDCAATWSIRWLLRPALARERCSFG